MSYSHVNEPYELGDLRYEGYSQKQIALLLGRSPSTISRELRRNKGGRGWRPGQVNELAQERLKVRGTSNAPRVIAISYRVDRYPAC